MKRRAAILAALAFSIGLHAFLITAGRSPRPASKVPDVLWSATIRFPEGGSDPVDDFMRTLQQQPEPPPRILR